MTTLEIILLIVSVVVALGLFVALFYMKKKGIDLSKVFSIFKGVTTTLDIAQVISKLSQTFGLDEKVVQRVYNEVKNAVTTAEGAYNDGLITKESRKTYATSLVKSALNASGVKVDSTIKNIIDILIEVLVVVIK